MDVALTEKEIEFMEFFHDPTALTENLTPINENAPQTWNAETDCIYLYPYQHMMQNFSYLVANDSRLTPQENFNKKKGAGDLFTIGSRNTGKSLLLKIDVFLSWIHRVQMGCVASFDQKHLSKVTDPIASYLESHPFAKIFHIKKGNTQSISRKHGGLRAISEHGCLIESANEKIDGNNPGTDFHAKHFFSLWYEEASYMSKEGTEKRVDACSSLGFIDRPSGIPDLRIGSPLTKILQNKKLKRWIWRLPQMVHPDWSDEKKQERIGQYNGENSSGYKLNILAETIEGAEGFWDMERLKKASYNISRKVKYFEVSKENFHKFKENIIVERLPGTEQVFIISDIGYSGSPSELIIIFKVGDKYKYVYNIPMFKLLHKEQAEVFKWLYDVLGGAFISTDSTGDNGAVIDDLFDMGIPQEHLLKVFFNANIDVDFEKDDEGNVLKDNNGKTLMKQANTLAWAMSELEHIMYDGLADIPQDEKLLEEFGGFIVKMNGTRKSYGSSTTDHLHQSIPKDETVLCRINNHINVDTIENIELLAQGKQIYVPTRSNNKLEWKKAYLKKEKNKDNLICDFGFSPGSFVKTTEGHSMMVWNSKTQLLEEKIAGDVEIGNLVLTPDAQKFVKLPQRNQYFNYETYNRSLKAFESNRLPLDEKLAYLFGMFTAEGHLMGRNQGVVLYIGTDLSLAKKILTDATTIFNRYAQNNGNIYTRKAGTRVSAEIVSKTDTYTVVFYGQKIAMLFSDNCGRGAKNKKVPNEIFEAKQPIVKAYLQGLNDGDANEKGTLTTISRTLATGVQVLNGKLGHYSAMCRVLNKFNNYEYYITSGVRDGYYRNVPLIAFEEKYSGQDKTLNRDKLKKANYKFCPRYEKNKEILQKIHDFNFLQVKSIKKYKYDDYVYDFYVPESENFVAGVGNIIVHNSFQCFAICRFFNEFNLLKNKSRGPRCYGVT